MTQQVELSCLLSTIGTNRKNAKESFEKGMGGSCMQDAYTERKGKRKGRDTQTECSTHWFEVR